METDHYLLRDIVVGIAAFSFHCLPFFFFFARLTNVTQLVAHLTMFGGLCYVANTVLVINLLRLSAVVESSAGEVLPLLVSIYALLTTTLYFVEKKHVEVYFWLNASVRLARLAAAGSFIYLFPQPLAPSTIQGYGDLMQRIFTNGWNEGLALPLVYYFWLITTVIQFFGDVWWVTGVWSSSSHSDVHQRTVWYDTVSFFQRITFSWISFLFHESRAGRLTLPSSGSLSFTEEEEQWRQIISRLPRIPDKLESYSNIFGPVYSTWLGVNRVPDAVPKGVWSGRKLYRLVRTLYQLEGGKEFIWVCVPLKIAQDLLSIVSHNSIGSIMLFVETSRQLSSEEEIIVAGLSLCLTNLLIRFLQAVLFQLYLAHLYTSSFKITTALKALLLQSVMETPLSAVSHSSSYSVPSADPPAAPSTAFYNEALALLTIDAERVGECLIFLHNTWSHPIVIFLALWNMYSSIGALPTLVTSVSLLCAIPLNKKGALIMKFAKRNAEDVLTRVSDLMVVLPTMRTVRAMNLQAAFLDRIKASRKKEGESAQFISRAEADASLLTEMIMVSVYILCYASYFLLGKEPVMTVSALLPATAALSVLRFPLWAAPNLVTQVVTGYDAAVRIESFLSRGTNICEATLEEEEEKENQDNKVNGARGSIQCAHVDFYWSKPQACSTPPAPNTAPTSIIVDMTREEKSSAPPLLPVLRSVDVSIAPGEFVVLLGGTGSGKTALLLGLLGELHAVPTLPSTAVSNTNASIGDMCRRKYCFGSIAYCPETPWIVDGTIQENIVMREMRPRGKEKQEAAAWMSGEEKAWYNTVLKACELEEDLRVMPQGDHTMITSTGSTLSGGQRARVALARALFYRMGDSDIFILDNVLSPLDHDLQQRIVQRVFHELIVQRGKTLLFATSIFPPNGSCDTILSIRDGRLSSEIDAEFSARNISGSSVVQQPESPASHGGSSPSSSLPTTELLKSKRKENGSLSHASFHLPSKEDVKAFYWAHFGPRTALLVVLVLVTRQLLYVITENWMGIWFFVQQKAECRLSDPSMRWIQLFHNLGGCDAVITFISTYVLMGLISCGVSWWRTNYFALSFQQAADRLQMSAARRVFRAPASFFDDTTSVNHVLQVLTNDQRVVDRLLPESTKLIITAILQVGAVVLINMVQYPLYVVVIPFVTLSFYFVTLNFLQLSKRLSLLRGHGNEKSLRIMKNILDGTVVIRAFGSGVRKQITGELCRALDDVSTISHAAIINDRWVALRLEFLSLFLLAILQFFIVASILLKFKRDGPDQDKEEASFYQGSSALAGLGVLALMNSAQQLGQLCRRLGMLLNQFVSVERLLQLERNTPQLLDSSDVESLVVRRMEGSSSQILSIQRLSCRYQSHLPSVLSSFSLTVKRGECVGIMGRSGEGKSTIFHALLQVMDEVKGELSVTPREGHEEETSCISLKELRKTLYFVPQEPLLIEGSLRENLELGAETPFGDAALLDVLQRIGLLPTLKINKKDCESVLDFHVMGSGKNLSSGQRQLISVGRALLYKPSVFLLDEVTSRLDSYFEQALMSAIRTEMKNGCAVLIIAHRRQTVEALCDRAIVIRSGRIIRELNKKEFSHLA